MITVRSFFMAGRRSSRSALRSSIMVVGLMGIAEYSGFPGKHPGKDSNL